MKVLACAAEGSERGLAVVDLKASVSVDGGVGNSGLPSPPSVYRDVITGGTNGEGAPARARPLEELQQFETGAPYD